MMQEYVEDIQMPGTSHSTRRTYLDVLESEAVYIIREAAALFERTVLLFSGGKDSLVVLRLAEKAFWPARIPFPVFHVDTGHNFPETIEFRDWLVRGIGVELIICSVQDSIDCGRVVEETGPFASRNGLQTVALLDSLSKHRVDAAICGARRDEDKARAKERVLSHRDIDGQWDPRNQRPEIWPLFNGRKAPGEHFRVFPLSNWTELDVWYYIAREGLPLPSLYFAHDRLVFRRGASWLADSPFIKRLPNETICRRRVRFRTVGDATCTGAVESHASTIQEIIEEIAVSPLTERSNRVDDQRSDTAMEERKRLGYF